MPASAVDRAARRPLGLARGAVAQHLHLLEGDETARHHLLEHRHERLDVVLAVDDLDHDRQILRQAQDLGGMQAARLAVAERPTQHGRAGEMQLARLQYDRLVERLAAVLVALAAEDPQQHRILGDLHHPPPEPSNARAPSTPSTTEMKHRTTDSTMLATTPLHSPSRARLRVCRLNDENVV